MTAAEAAAYHGLQARAFAEAGAHMISAITMTYAEEAIGVARAATAVERAGRDLPDRRDRRPAAVRAGDRRRDRRRSTWPPTADRPTTCSTAHTPRHFLAQLDVAAGWTTRIKGVRANASRLSHAELDAATELDRGDIAELAQLYAALQTGLDLRVVGGCCGTDDEHIGAIAAAVGLVEDPGNREARAWPL